MAQLALKKPIIFFDLETTGIDPAKDRIVEIAMIKINPDTSRDQYIKKLNPGMPIPKEASDIHGITDEDVKEAPHFKHIAHDLYQWMQGCDLGGYNSNKFDIPVLAEEFLRSNIDVDFTERKMIDVQQIFFKMESRSLTAAYKFYCQKTLENAHSAEADVSATIDVLEAQLDRYQELSHEVPALHKFTGGEQFVDYAKRLVMKDGQAIFNFGKYKGMKVEEVFAKEPQYYDWMMQADFTLHTKQKISEILNKMKLQKLGLKS